MDISRTGIELGPFDLFGLTINPTLHFYGLLIVLGILAASYVVARLAKIDGKDPEHVWNGLVWGVLGGIIGARAWFVFFPPDTSVEAGKTTGWMLRNFFDTNDGAIAIWNGGLGIFGALIGGFIGIYFYARRKKMRPFWEWIDMAIVGVPLGHAIGRWGNYVNQELYGKPTDLPWGIKIDNPPAEYADAERFHPLFLYESLWNLLLFGFLLWLWLNYRQRMKRGDFLLIYMIGYGIVRFLLEFLRVEPAHIPGLDINSSQAFTAISVVISSVLLFYRHRFGPAARPTGTHPDGRPIGKPKKQKS